MALFQKPVSPAVEKARSTVEELRRKLKLDPANVPAILALAEALATLGEKQEAVQQLSRSGAALQRQDRLLDAITVYRKVQQIDPKGEIEASAMVSITLQKLQQEAKKAAAASPAAPASSGPAPPPGVAVSPPASSPAGGPARDEIRKKKEAVQSAVAGIPILKDVPPFLFEVVLEKVELRTLPAAGILFREGEPGASVFFVISGELAVTTMDDAGKDVSLGTLGKGDVAGEISFLSGLPRSATLTATGETVVLELDRRAIDPIARRHRRVGDALTAFYKERVLDGVLARTPLFAGLTREERATIAQRLTPLAVKPGDPIIREGARDDTLFLLRRGEVRVTTKQAGEEVVLADLGPHAFFGDIAALRGTARTASVTASAEVELLCLSRKHLDELLVKHPELRERLENVQLERFVATSRLLT